MIDPAAMHKVLKNANPIPVGQFDPDELANFLATFSARFIPVAPVEAIPAVVADAASAVPSRLAGATTSIGDEEMTDVLTDQKSTSQPHRTEPPRRKRFVLGFAMAVLVIVVGATGWWIGSSDTDTTEAAPPAEIQALLDDFYAAFASYDGAAMAELLAEDFRMATEWTPPLRADDLVRRIDMGETLKWTLEPVSEPIMIGDTAEPSFPLDGAYVTSVDVMTGTGISGGAGFSTFLIVIEDGVPKVASYEFPLGGYLAANEWWFEQ